MSISTTSAIPGMESAAAAALQQQLLSYYESPFWGEFSQLIGCLMLISMICVLCRIVRVHLVNLPSHVMEKNTLILNNSLFGIALAQGYTYVTTNSDRWQLVMFVSGLMCVGLFLPLCPLLHNVVS
jgi:hypothetical protein